MTDFSKIKNNLQTGRDEIVKNFVSSTGLSKERVEKLYESFNYECQGDLKKINESFIDLINPEARSFDFEGFKTEILHISTTIAEGSITTEERSQLTDKFYQIVNKYCGVNVDTPTLIEVICFILLLKNENFQPVQSKIKFGLKVQELFESEKLNFSKVNVSKLNNLSDNQINASEDKRLYESLKLILSRNNKRWGYNYHLDNVYSSIVSYLDKEIVQLTNMDNIVAINDNFHMELLNQIVTQEQLNPMYRQISVLKTLIPDMQTLVFDCMLLFHNYVSQQQYSLQYIARPKMIGYIEASKTLYAAIVSSQQASKIAYSTKNIVTPDEKESINSQTKSYASSSIGSNYSQVFDNFAIDLSKVELEVYPLRSNSAVDLLHIIKASETEFNLHLRKVINNYFTKSMELIASTDHIMREQRKTNKFKNGY